MASKKIAKAILSLFYDMLCDKCTLYNENNFRCKQLSLLYLGFFSLSSVSGKHTINDERTVANAKHHAKCEGDYTDQETTCEAT